MHKDIFHVVDGGIFLVHIIQANKDSNKNRKYIKFSVQGFSHSQQICLHYHVEDPQRGRQLVSPRNYLVAHWNTFAEEDAIEWLWGE